MASEEKWYPPQRKGFGPWIEHDGTLKAPEDTIGKVISRLFDYEREHKKFHHTAFLSEATDRDWSDVAAYCVKLEDKPAAATQTETWHDWHEGDTVPAVDRVDVIRVTAGIKGAAESQIDNVVTTSQYWGPNSFVRKWRPAVVKSVADPNTNMISRDADGAVSCVRQSHKIDWSSFDHAAIIAAGRAYARRVHNERVSAAAWVERPRDHRLGSFN